MPTEAEIICGLCLILAAPWLLPKGPVVEHPCDSEASLVQTERQAQRESPIAARPLYGPEALLNMSERRSSHLHDPQSFPLRTGMARLAVKTAGTQAVNRVT